MASTVKVTTSASLISRAAPEEPTTTPSGFAQLFPFSAGLNGVDQDSNYFSVHLLVGLFLTIVACTLALRLAQIGTAWFRLGAIMANPRNQRFWARSGNSWAPWLKRHLLYAPIINKRHNHELRLTSAVTMGTLPSRGHLLIIILYSSINLAVCLVLPYGEKREVVWASFRGRTGTLAAYNLLVGTLFALKNDPLIHLLRVPYDTFNLFHRWIMRIMILEAILHVIAWLSNTAYAGGWTAVRHGLTEGSHAPSFAWGLVSVMCATLIFLQAWSPVRHAVYDLFVQLHRLLAVLVFLGTFLHIELDHLPQRPWMYVLLLVYLSEYVVRTYRIVKYNFSPRQKWARVKVVALKSEVCRVSFELARPWTRPRAGAHVQTYFPTIAPFTSHPFSVAWAHVLETKAVTGGGSRQWVETKAAAAQAGNSDADGFEMQDLEAGEGKRPVTKKALSFALEPPLQRPTKVIIQCCVKARTGFTRRLWERARTAPGHTLETYGVCEGFYGGHETLASYGTVLLFAGGIGITHQLMYVRELLEEHEAKMVATRRIVLCWSVPTADCLEWVKPEMDHILAMRTRRHALQVLLFVSQPGARKNDMVSSTGSVRLLAGRCNVGEVLDQTIDERVGAMAVSVCGPGAFADAVRNAVRKRVDRGAMIDFNEEAFTY